MIEAPTTRHVDGLAVSLSNLGHETTLQEAYRAGVVVGFAEGPPVGVGLATVPDWSATQVGEADTATSLHDFASNRYRPAWLRVTGRSWARAKRGRCVDRDSCRPRGRH